MAIVKPFKAVRPVKDKVHLVASRSYVSYNDEQLHAKLSENPFTFIHIINPDHDRPNPAPRASTELFRRIAHRFNEFLDEGTFVREQKPCLYLYKQDRGNAVSIGIIGVVANKDYRDGKIKKHEQTIERREALFAQYLNTVSFNAEPVLLCHENNDHIDDLYRQAMAGMPEYDFTTTDRSRHTLWAISDEQLIQDFGFAYEQLESLYIADGHHRSASSARLSEFRYPDGNVASNEACEFFMAYIIPASSLSIHSFHRVIKDLNGLSKDEFLAKLVPLGNLEKINHPMLEKHKGMIDIYLEGEWYRLDASSKVKPFEPDSSWLTNNILNPLLDIKDLRTDKRIRFRPGSVSVLDLASQVDSGDFACAMALHPVAFAELKHISDHGGTMPPKSTWIQPKLRSGLTVFTFLEDEKVSE